MLDRPRHLRGEVLIQRSAGGDVDAPACRGRRASTGLWSSIAQRARASSTSSRSGSVVRRAACGSSCRPPDGGPRRRAERRRRAGRRWRGGCPSSRSERDDPRDRPSRHQDAHVLLAHHPAARQLARDLLQRLSRHADDRSRRHVLSGLSVRLGRSWGQRRTAGTGSTESTTPSAVSAIRLSTTALRSPVSRNRAICRSALVPCSRILKAYSTSLPAAQLVHDVVHEPLDQLANQRRAPAAPAPSRSRSACRRARSAPRATCSPRSAPADRPGRSGCRAAASTSWRRSPAGSRRCRRPRPRACRRRRRGTRASG